ncbi:hypothetical protein CXP34_03970 [Ralstonia mannitolilytica]|nr:hypothetical protein CXP34_03970 [Ralstonia mannitolilytica]
MHKGCRGTKRIAAAAPPGAEALFQLVLATASGTRIKSGLDGLGANQFVPWQLGAVMQDVYPAPRRATRPAASRATQRRSQPRQCSAPRAVQLAAITRAAEGATRRGGVMARLSRQ